MLHIIYSNDFGYKDEIPNCYDVIYAVCLLETNIKSDRLLERACKNAKRLNLFT